MKRIDVSKACPGAILSEAIVSTGIYTPDRWIKSQILYAGSGPGWTKVNGKYDN